MRVLFIHPSPLMYSELYLRLEPLGVERVAQAGRLAGHKVRILDLQISLVDVVNEQRNLFQSQNALAEARNNYILNWVSLKESASSLSLQDMDTVNGLLVHGVSEETSAPMEDSQPQGL